MNKITAVELWEARKDCVILDVRSPGEFLKGHIPRASNLPIFSDYSFYLGSYKDNILEVVQNE